MFPSREPGQVQQEQEDEQGHGQGPPAYDCLDRGGQSLTFKAPAACSFPGENARSWEALGAFQTTQGNRLSCRDQEGRRGSEEAVPGPSVFPSGEPGVLGDFWGSQEGCQGPSRPSGRNRG